MIGIPVQSRAVGTLRTGIHQSVVNLWRLKLIDLNVVASRITTRSNVAIIKAGSNGTANAVEAKVIINGYAKQVEATDAVAFPQTAKYSEV
ncbi:hypothetical protein MAM1_0389c10258 [Mucor ambiguus]|uniref:Uncharacterized protein n=1 Tax=Mucor ambiguus TaxID=91626 RepID=A0A0C9N7U3_9FUNG|nr:hypothetical protein MAM1_0389c10258 [Mucor ambiguus]